MGRMNLEERLDIIGSAFRGLWRNCHQFNKSGELISEDVWCVTFLYDRQYVETPGCKSPEEALDFALKKLLEW